MDDAFWHERWERDELGFHQAEVNGSLVRHWPALELAPGDPVFVPLCGKSLDLHWLRERGHPVHGIELSETAVRAFFEEANLKPVTSRRGSLASWEVPGLRIDQGDFFDLTPAETEGLRGAYDRAALIALPPEMRERYAAQMARLMPASSRSLVIALEYDQTEMNGPPHAVLLDEVETLYGNAFELEELALADWSAPHPRFQERGLTRWRERVFGMTRRSGGSAS